MTIFEDFDCWVSPNQLNPGFHAIDQNLVNFSNLGLVPRLKCVNDKIKNISSRKLFKEHYTKFSNQYLQNLGQLASAHFWVIFKNQMVFDDF